MVRAPILMLAGLAISSPARAKLGLELECQKFHSHRIVPASDRSVEDLQQKLDTLCDELDNHKELLGNLRRKEPIVKGTDFTLEADDTLLSWSDIEYVVHWPDDKSGFALNNLGKLALAGTMDRV